MDAKACLNANETQTRKVQCCPKKGAKEVCKCEMFFSPAIELFIKINLFFRLVCSCKVQACLSNDFPSEAAVVRICWEKNWVCTVCTGVNVYYSQI